MRSRSPLAGLASGRHQPEDASSGPSLTPRAVIIACLLLPINAYWITQMAVVRYEGHPTTVSLFFNAVFLLFVLRLGNTALRRLSPRLALHRNELLVIYAMVTVGSALCGHDLVQVVTPQIVMPFWLATPENQWEELFFQYLPDHLTVSDPSIYVPAFEGGATLYTRERLLAWLPPVASWGLFLAVLTTMMLAINALLRRRWMDQEKLTYPIVHMPLELSRDDAALLRSRMMWLGFALAAAVDLLNGIHELRPAWPLIKVRVVHFDAMMRSAFTGYPWAALRGSRISFYPFAIGLGMLLPLDLAFSCWFFYLFWRAQTLLSMLLGLNRIPGFPYVNEQSSGAYLGLCAFALYMARRRLSRLLRRTLRGRAEDEGEPMSYSLAMMVIFGGLLFLALFTAAMGMWLWLAALFFLLYFGLSLAVTRIRAELGPPAHDLHRGGPDLILTNIFGTDGTILPPGQLTALSLCFWFNRAYRAHPMPVQLESFKIADSTGIRQSHMAMALTIAAFLGAFAAFWAQVHSYYAYGINAKMSFVATTFGREPFQRLRSWLMHTHGTDWPRVGAYVVGIGFTWLLMVLRINFVNWPFHPVGYAISSSWSMNCLWLPILIAWAAKWVITHYGGHRAYQRAIPFALGLVLGEFIVGSLWCIIGIALGIDTYSFWV
ncbi:MAG: DUF6785 family protein [Armatimonadota bacterium]|nr:DUF6785 family protein [Armatimonadota bacterium]